jgi:hypothetical protein
VVERQPERAELVLVPACAEAEHEATAGDLRDRGGHLGDHRRRVKGHARHQRPELHTLGGGGKRSQHRPGLPRAALGSTVAIEQVVTEPDRVEPGRLGGVRHGEVLGPGDLALDLW